MKLKYLYAIFVIIFVSALLFLTGCDSLFFEDGNSEEGISPRGGFFYLIDNGSFSLLMFDVELNLLESWDLGDISDNQDIRGLTFDGRNFWISVATSSDSIYKLSPLGDSLVVVDSFEAPPDGQGVIRGLAWDGLYLWAVNSGSTTYSTPPQLFRIDPSTYSVLETYQIPTPEPRALTYIRSNSDVYGYGPRPGIYYTDTEMDVVYGYETDKRVSTKYFDSPEPPRGSSFRYPIGLSWDGTEFWLVNISSVADHLYRLDYDGQENIRVELTYDDPGPIVWSKSDARLSSPMVEGIVPNVGKPGDTLSVTVTGSFFLPGDGLRIRVGAGIEVMQDSTVYVSDSKLRTVMVIAPDASLGRRDVTVTNPTGKSDTGYSLFTVSEIDPNDGFIWVADANDGMLSKIRISDETVVQQWDVGTFTGSNSLRGLAFDGTHIWMSIAGSEDRIFQLDTSGSSLSYISAIPAPPGTPDGVVREIAFNDSGDLWVSNSSSGDDIQQIYRVDKTDGTVLEMIDTPDNNLRGITFAEGVLYGNDYSEDMVYTYDFSSGTWSVAFDAPIPPGGDEGNRYPVGMAWDGINLWMGNSTYEFDYIFQMTMTGTVLRTISVPNQGDAQITGIIHTAE